MHPCMARPAGSCRVPPGLALRVAGHSGLCMLPPDAKSRALIAQQGRYVKLYVVLLPRHCLCRKLSVSYSYPFRMSCLLAQTSPGGGKLSFIHPIGETTVIVTVTCTLPPPLLEVKLRVAV